MRYRSLQAEHIRFHEKSLGHKFAAASWFKPDEPVCITLQATAEDDRLLSGNVPQPQDWVRAWRISRDPRSWQAAEHDDETFNFLCQIRPKAVQRKKHFQFVEHEAASGAKGLPSHFILKLLVGNCDQGCR